jgi:hypothetical protein
VVEFEVRSCPKSVAAASTPLLPCEKKLPVKRPHFNGSDLGLCRHLSARDAIPRSCPISLAQFPACLGPASPACSINFGLEKKIKLSRSWTKVIPYKLLVFL